MKKVSYLLVVLTTVLLFLGGLGIEKNLIELQGVIFAVLLVFAARIIKGKLSFPKTFSLYMVFLILAFASTFWSQDIEGSFEYLMLFVTGGLFWLSFYNLKDELRKVFPWSLLVLGFIFILSYLAYILKGSNWRVPYSLVTPYTDNHHHLGDFWALVAVFLFYENLKKRRWELIITLIIALAVLAFSLSRSAYVALAVGVFYIFLKKGKFKKFKKPIVFVLVLAYGLFLFASVFKTTVYSRVYFLQGILGFIKNPLGVGLGNFLLISKDLITNPWGGDFFSLFAHNIFLEVLVGMGVLGLSFVVWFLIVARSLWRSKKEEGLLYQALFFVLAANFFFDITYCIPTMFWLWYLVLGLGQNDIILRKVAAKS
ncbi:O-antigen ligase domain-containing protein [Candidatus Woesebacteria bacterium]|nr:MAG: O-antigen ligase domain-containing protein [Candidatus Woesebacteria bacterium]